MGRRKKSFILGSNTAKNGFKNEDSVVKKFNDWKNDEDAKKWLSIMGYNIEKIEKVVAEKVHGYKTDVQINIYLKKLIPTENISIKLVSNPRGFNQVDKRWIDSYVKLWKIPTEITNSLKLFTGETKPLQKKLFDERRMLLTEMEEEDRQKIVDFFKKNKALVISDILKGRDEFSAGWMLVALNIDGETKWTLKPINEAMKVFAEGKVEVTSQGSLRIGKVTMQRKGGDGGRKTAQMLQFKINPVELFS